MKNADLFRHAVSHIYIYSYGWIVIIIKSTLLFVGRLYPTELSEKHSLCLFRNSKWNISEFHENLEKCFLVTGSINVNLFYILIKCTHWVIIYSLTHIHKTCPYALLLFALIYYNSKVLVFQSLAPNVKLKKSSFCYKLSVKCLGQPWLNAKRVYMI